MLLVALHILDAHNKLLSHSWHSFNDSHSCYMCVYHRLHLGKKRNNNSMQFVKICATADLSWVNIVFWLLVKSMLVTCICVYIYVHILYINMCVCVCIKRVRESQAGSHSEKCLVFKGFSGSSLKRHRRPLYQFLSLVISSKLEINNNKRSSSSWCQWKTYCFRFSLWHFGETTVIKLLFCLFLSPLSIRKYKEQDICHRVLGYFVNTISAW